MFFCLLVFQNIEVLRIIFGSLIQRPFLRFEYVGLIDLNQ